MVRMVRVSICSRIGIHDVGVIVRILRVVAWIICCRVRILEMRVCVEVRTWMSVRAAITIIIVIVVDDDRSIRQGQRVGHDHIGAFVGGSGHFRR